MYRDRQKTFPSAEETVRVDITVDAAAQELLPEEVHTLYSPSGLWIVDDSPGRIVIKAYPEHVETYLAAIRGYGIDLHDVRVVREGRRDYSEIVKRYFRPIRVEDIVIRAPWNKQKEGVDYITIEPGMAFGTGRHESTRLMIKLMRTVDIDGKRVLEIGCGSALLSLYARIKGAGRIYAVDNDLDAVLSAQKNVLLNGAGGIEIVCADLTDIRGTYDIVLANLDIRTFSMSSGHILGLVRPGGLLVVSGIIGKEKREALELFAPYEPVAEAKKNAWLGFVFKKSSRFQVCGSRGYGK